MWGKSGFAATRSGITDYNAEKCAALYSGDVPTTSEAQVLPVPRPAHSVVREPETHEKSHSNRLSRIISRASTFIYININLFLIVIYNCIVIKVEISWFQFITCNINNEF